MGVGPGNFTGIRISVSAARGLALGLGIPALGVSGFAARAHGQPLPFTATIPAPRGQSYRQEFQADGRLSDPVQIAEAQDLQPAAADLIANTASIAAARFLAGDIDIRPAPLYVRSADAAPPRDAPPKILT